MTAHEAQEGLNRRHLFQTLAAGAAASDDLDLGHEGLHDRLKVPVAGVADGAAILPVLSAIWSAARIAALVFLLFSSSDPRR